jgi:hypothetical protein
MSAVAADSIEPDVEDVDDPLTVKYALKLSAYVHAHDETEILAQKSEEMWKKRKEEYLNLDRMCCFQEKNPDRRISGGLYCFFPIDFDEGDLLIVWKNIEPFEDDENHETLRILIRVPVEFMQNAKCYSFCKILDKKAYFHIGPSELTFQKEPGKSLTLVKIRPKKRLAFLSQKLFARRVSDFECEQNHRRLLTDANVATAIHDEKTFRRIVARKRQFVESCEELNPDVLRKKQKT